MFRFRIIGLPVFLGIIPTILASLSTIASFFIQIGGIEWTAVFSTTETRNLKMDNYYLFSLKSKSAKIEQNPCGGTCLIERME